PVASICGQCPHRGMTSIRAPSTARRTRSAPVHLLRRRVAPRSRGWDSRRGRADARGRRAWLVCSPAPGWPDEIGGRPLEPEAAAPAAGVHEPEQPADELALAARVREPERIGRRLAEARRDDRLGAAESADP